ncbi:MAG: 50S ribosomal protein L11 methyltransferase [Fimbriimonadaceae bacterium]|nr:50S ribosomal protein L11 methyltransferase [Chitinophagales bacterium]
MNYSEYHLIAKDEATAEILIALLAEYGFDTFEQNESEIFAYMPAQNISDTIEEKIIDLQLQFQFTYTSKIYEDKNWNEEWEKNFQPVVVANKVLIRAPFHDQDKTIPHEIIIEPRMSFGTGHHASTYLMIEHMLEIEFANKTVCDAGCGTGILAIFAALQGAKQVLAFDNNEWAYNNSIDNKGLNKIDEGVIFELAELDIMQQKEFDIILANINKTIIIENLPLFKSSLLINGTLLLSGILISDLPDVIAEAVKHGFQLRNSKTKDDWVCAELGF